MTVEATGRVTRVSENDETIYVSFVLTLGATGSGTASYPRASFKRLPRVGDWMELCRNRLQIVSDEVSDGDTVS